MLTNKSIKTVALRPIKEVCHKPGKIAGAGIPMNKLKELKDHILYKLRNCCLPVGVKVKDGTVGKRKKTNNILSINVGISSVQ